MPLYEYRCEKCGELFEVRQKFADDPLTTHEKCGGKVDRLLSAPSLQFKGSGWYVNDYPKGGSTGANGGSGKSDTAEKKDAGSGSTTPAEKPSTPASDKKIS